MRLSRWKPRVEMRKQTPKRRGEESEAEKGDETTKRTWTALVLHCLIVVAAISGGLALYASQRVETLEDRLETQIVNSEERIQELDALVGFDSRRRRLLLGLRDRILTAGADLNYDQSYRYARLAIEATEKYPSVDPVLLVAIGVVESRYDERAKSPAGAVGLYQIIPSTARLLTRSLGWEYTDTLLYDPRKNTELAALYLEVLFAAYNDPLMVLAEYNGGPLNAGYLRAGAHHRLSSETRDYVDKVAGVYQELKLKLDGEMAADRGRSEPAAVQALDAARPVLSRPKSSIKAYLGSLKKAHYPTMPLVGR